MNNCRSTERSLPAICIVDITELTKVSGSVDVGNITDIMPATFSDHIAYAIVITDLSEDGAAPRGNLKTLSDSGVHGHHLMRDLLPHAAVLLPSDRNSPQEHKSYYLAGESLSGLIASEHVVCTTMHAAHILTHILYYYSDRQESAIGVWRKHEHASCGSSGIDRAAIYRYDYGVSITNSALWKASESIPTTAVYRDKELVMLQSKDLQSFARGAAHSSLAVDKDERIKDIIIALDHIGIVSKVGRKIEKFLRAAGYMLAYEGEVEELQVNCRYFKGVTVDLETVTPLTPDSTVHNHYDRMPMAPLHHIAFEVRSLQEAAAWFEERGYRRVSEAEHFSPKPFHKVLFLSPVQTGGLLVELVEDQR